MGQAPRPEGLPEKKAAPPCAGLHRPVKESVATLAAAANLPGNRPQMIEHLAIVASCHHRASRGGEHGGLPMSRKPKTTRAYTATGITQTTTDDRGNTATTYTDLAGRTISSTDAAGNSRSMTRTSTSPTSSPERRSGSTVTTGCERTRGYQRGTRRAPSPIHGGTFALRSGAPRSRRAREAAPTPQSLSRNGLRSILSHGIE